MPYNVVNSDSVLASKISNNYSASTMPYNIVNQNSVLASKISNNYSASTMPYNIVNQNSVLTNINYDNYSKLSSIQMIPNVAENKQKYSSRVHKSFIVKPGNDIIEFIRCRDIYLSKIKHFSEFYDNLYNLVKDKTYFDLIINNNIITKLSHDKINLPNDNNNLTKYNCNNYRLLYSYSFQKNSFEPELIKFYNSINKSKINNLIHLDNNTLHDNLWNYVNGIIQCSRTQDGLNYFFVFEDNGCAYPGWSFMFLFGYNKHENKCLYFKIIIIQHKSTYCTIM